MSWTLVEPCAGTGALSMHYLGATRSLMPYQGSKWRLRRQISDTLAHLHPIFEEPPSSYLWGEPGPWCNTLWQLSSTTRSRVLSVLKMLERMDPQQAYDALQGHPVPEDGAVRAAQHLFLQRLAFSGKAVQVTDDGRWASPGFNRTSAYGTPATERFGRVKPMVGSLIETIRRLPEFGPTIAVHEGPIEETLEMLPGMGPSLVYIDPPYRGVTGYGHQLERAHLVELVLDGMREHPQAFWAISEAEPLDHLFHGASSFLIGDPSDKANPFKGKQPEWLTVCMP